MSKTNSTHGCIDTINTGPDQETATDRYQSIAGKHEWLLCHESKKGVDSLDSLCIESHIDKLAAISSLAII